LRTPNPHPSSHPRPARQHPTSIGSDGVPLAAITALLLALCAGPLTGCTWPWDSDRTEESPGLSTSSADGYDDREYGLISASTLEAWLEDWPANRPPSIDGRLIVLQVNTGFPGMEFITPREESSILTYGVPSEAWSMTRSDGVMSVKYMVLDGSTMDGLLQRYDIDPRHDMVLLVMARGGTYASMLLGRAWYLFRYWGMPTDRLAALNGAADVVLNAALLSSVSSTPPGDGQATVADFPEDGFSMQATLEEVIQAAEASEDAGEGSSEVFLWDARSTDEYAGVAGQTSGVQGNTCGEDGNDGCLTAFEGHVRNAANLDYRALLISDDGVTDISGNGSIGSEDASYRYRPVQELEMLVAELGYGQGQTIMTYCRIGYRAAVVMMASAVALELPTRLFDGAWLEWSQLACVPNQSGEPSLEQDSPWRTDLDSRSFIGAFNSSARVEVPDMVAPYADHSQDLIEADRAYKADR